MRTLVTAVLVARTGGEWLEQTLAALNGQTRTPDRIVAVAAGGGERLAAQLAAGGAQRIVAANGVLPFGEAVKRGVEATPAWAGSEPDPAAGGADAAGVADGPAAPGTGDDAPETREWLWLLSEDSAPEPEALERILETVQRAPSVALAGPKLVDWDRPERIIELGQSLTRGGARWVLRRQELDQQQYDHLQDVLGVGPVGLLVRRDVWEQLGGFNPALPVFDDGLDLSVRARLAGFRVVVAPASRIRFARSGVAGPRIDRSRAVLRVAHRQARTAHLHRRIAYAPGVLAVFIWLGLPLVAVARVFWALIREQPGQMLGEFTAAMRVFFTPGSILASRRRIAAVNRAGWAAVRPLRVDPKTVRTTRMIDREAILAAQGRQQRELHFVSTGGLAVLIASLVIAAALAWWALPQTSLSGGALAPLSSFGELWRNTLTQNGVPADPFTWVLALLGSLTFWNPSHAIVLLFVLAVPLAALGGWIWAAGLTGSTAGRALLGLGWALSPVLLGSLGSGRLPTIVLAIALPWLLLAATRCRESWSWAGAASLLAAVALACAPILIPAAIVLFLVGLASSLRGITRVLATAVAPLVLFAPKLVSLIGGQPIDLFIDPGLTPVFRPGTVWQSLLGFPEFGLAGWGPILDALGLGDAPATLLVGVLLLPVVLLAVLGLVTGRVFVTVLLALTAGLGLLTALASAQLRLVSEGADVVAVWTGSGLALYWIGVLSLAAVGCTVLARAAAPIVAVALVTALVVAAPLAVRLVLGQTGLRPGDAQLPAIVQAAGTADPELHTLVLTATGERSVRAELITGVGVRLDPLRTADRAPETTAQDRWVAELVGLLASTGEDERLRSALAEHGVGFVLLDGGGDAAERALLQSAVDRSTALEGAGQTEHGLLWRLQGEVSPGSEAPGSTTRVLEGTTLSGRTVWVLQIVVLLGMVLLALPTGEVVERPERRRRAKRGGAADPVPGPEVGAVPESGAAPEAGAAPDADPGPDADPVPETDSAPDADPVSETDSALESDPEPGVGPGPDTDPAADPDTDTDTDPDTAAESDPGPAAVGETGSEPVEPTDPDPGVDPGPGADPEAGADPGPVHPSGPGAESETGSER